MAIDIVLPSLSAGMQDGLIARWLKAEGERAEKGEVIAEIETDKATMELEAASSGRLGRILIGEGKRAAVNQIIAVLLGDNEDIDDLPARSSAGAVSAPLPEARIAPPAVAYAGTTLGRVAASPLARRMARENGIDPASLMGSGPRGRIVRIDVERATPNASATSPVLPTLTEPVIASSVPPIPFGIGEYEAVSHSGMRRVIARRLVEAKNTIPHFYLTSDCAIDDLLTLRAQMNELRTASGRISINDLVIKAAAVALQTVPDANVIWTEEALLRLKTIDISVAVATEGGLITPVIRDAGSKSVGAISCEISALAARARENRLKPEEYQEKYVQSSTEELGLSVESITIKDIIVPASIRRAYAGILEAQKEARKKLEQARGEQAVLRNLANSSAMYDKNPALLQARLIQALSSGHNSIVFNAKSGLTIEPNSEHPRVT